jgi:integrase
MNVIRFRSEEIRVNGMGQAAILSEIEPDCRLRRCRRDVDRREVGVPLEVIQKRLGHRSIRTTADVYGSLPARIDRDVADQLDALLCQGRDVPRTLRGEAGDR